MANSNSNGAPKLPALSDETIRQFLNTQQQELAIRMEEVRRDTAEIELNKSIAKDSISAQERDRSSERTEQTKRQRERYFFNAFVLVGILAFCVFALYTGKDALLLDFLKVIAGFAGGVGFHAWRTHGRATSTESWN